MRPYKVIEVSLGQTLWDIAVQEYGSLDGVMLLVEDNIEQLNMGFDTDVVPGMLLKIRSKPADKETKQVIEEQKKILNTGSVPFLGEYSDDFNEDFTI
jgi:hypothetical protein